MFVPLAFKTNTLLSVTGVKVVVGALNVALRRPLISPFMTSYSFKRQSIV